MKILLETTMGNITVALYDQTPKHRDNFTELVEKGFYDGLLFHRVIEDFMVQGGDPDSLDAVPGQRLGAGGLDYTVEAEFRYPELVHKRGALAAARQGDAVNPKRRSSSCQFYIVWGTIYEEEEIDQMAMQMERYTRGQVVMPESVKEIYRTVGGTPHLDGQYTVFGEVIEGLNVIEAMQEVRTDRSDRPYEDIKIIKASVVKE